MGKQWIGWMLLFFSAVPVWANPSTEEAEESPSLRGKYYLFWGWNRAAYTRSDLHIKGSTYDFTLHDVKAKDVPLPFRFSPYLNPTEFTIPQTNFRLGTYINNKWSVAFGFDHMKYRATNGQEITISGNIAQTGSGYDGTYDQSPLTLDSALLTYENTDGLNYVFFAIYRHFDLLKDLPLGSKISAIVGWDLASVWPWTNAQLFRKPRRDRFHIGGVGTGATAGLVFRIGKVFSIRSEMKAGYINLFDVRISRDKSDRAKQQFFYAQPSIMFGAEFPLNKLAIFR